MAGWSQIGQRAGSRWRYARRWLGEFVDAAAGIDRYRHDVAEHIVPACGSQPLVEVTPAEIGALLVRIGAEVSPARAAQVWETLRELFVDAVDDGIIASTPMPDRPSS